MKLPRGAKLLTTPRQVEAIASPLRVEILEHLLLAGASSVADLAERMGRRPPALHYHVKVLQAAGIVRVARWRKAGKRSEALFRLAAQSFAVAGRLSEERSMGHALRTLGATLRLAQRETRRALSGARVRARGAQRNFHSRRLRAPLSAVALAQVNGYLDRLERVFARAVKQHVRGSRSGSGRGLPARGVVSLTFVLTPAGE